MLTREEFLALVEAHLEARNVAATVLGKEAIGDPNFVRELRDGRSPSIDTVNKVLAHMQAQTEAA